MSFHPSRACAYVQSPAQPEWSFRESPASVEPQIGQAANRIGQVAVPAISRVQSVYLMAVPRHAEAPSTPQKKYYVEDRSLARQHSSDRVCKDAAFATALPHS